MKKQGALSKIGGGGIDNQWFKYVILLIVRRPFFLRLCLRRSATLCEGRSKVYAWWTPAAVARQETKVMRQESRDK